MLSNNTERTNTNTIISVKDALLEYFKLKRKMEERVSSKKHAIYARNLSKREQKTAFSNLEFKCVNCERPSKLGTIFNTTYHEADGANDAYRILSASCGVIANPCALDIQISIGKTETIDDLLRTTENEIKSHKNAIIDNKNKLLFGLITSEEAVDLFDESKEAVSLYTEIYEGLINTHTDITNNREKKEALEEATISLYENIERLKNSIKKLEETNDTQYSNDAAELYTTVISPLLKKIRALKYSSVYISTNEKDDTHHLVQQPYTYEDITVSQQNLNVVKAFVVGGGSIQQSKPKPPRTEKSTKKMQIQILPEQDSSSPPFILGTTGADMNTPPMPSNIGTPPYIPGVTGADMNTPPMPSNLGTPPYIPGVTEADMNTPPMPSNLGTPPYTPGVTGANMNTPPMPNSIEPSSVESPPFVLNK